MNYLQMLEDGHTAVQQFGGHTSSRLEYLADHIFDFTTYDSAMSELFASKAVEVCAAISDGKTFDYIQDPVNYQWFLLMCNMPFFSDRIEWGTSIRGAWWDHEDHEFSSDGLWLDDAQMADAMTMSRVDWLAFIEAVRRFATAQPARKE